MVEENEFELILIILQLFFIKIGSRTLDYIFEKKKRGEVKNLYTIQYKTCLTDFFKGKFCVCFSYSLFLY